MLANETCSWSYGCCAIHTITASPTHPLAVPVPDTDLPRPYESGWPRATRAAAQAFWDWHDALRDAAPTSERVLDADCKAADAGERLRLVPDAVSEAAYEACREHGLKRRYLAAQVHGLKHHQPPVRYETGADLKRFLDRWVVPHGRLLAGLVPGAGSLKRATDHLSRGFFYTAMVTHLPQHLADDRLYIPLSDIEQVGTSVRELRRASVTEPVRKLLWKQSIRARDALAHGHPALTRLSWRPKWRLKFWWLGALEVLSEVERRDFDVWSEPIALDRWHTAQVYLQTYLGRATGRMS